MNRSVCLCLFVAVLVLGSFYFAGTAVGQLTRLPEQGVADRPTPYAAPSSAFGPPPHGISSASYDESYPLIDFGTHGRHYCPECDDEWAFQLLPDSIIYKSYLAGKKEPRLAAHLVDIPGDSTCWEGVLGGRVGLFRYGNRDPVLPQGIQWDVEAAAQVRLDIPEDVDVRSVDFRAGTVITFGYGRHQTKFGYYHVSSHLGDEFVLKNPLYPRLNYVRDALVLGQAYNFTENLRLYAEAAWAFHLDVAKPWEFQFGVDWAPARATGLWGAPFFAVNGHLREEVNFGGNFVVQTGWAWRGDDHAHLLRLGFHYFNGKSDQYSFYNNFEEQLGFGVWYDF